MSLRLRYSLRQALPVGLFGLPLLVLERALAHVVGNGEMELSPGGLSLFALIAMPLLAACTFTLAYVRFEAEFRHPFRSERLFWGPLSTLLLIAPAALLTVVSSGVPTNEYHWARLGIIAAGMVLGVLPFKWLYFDWLNRQANDSAPPQDNLGSGVPARRPVGPPTAANHGSVASLLVEG